MKDLIQPSNINEIILDQLSPNTAFISNNSDAAHEATGWLHKIAQDKDKTAFIALFNYFAPRVKAYLRRQGLDASAAEDITQDVMLLIWNRAALFDAKKARASTWIFTIARNRLIDVWRQQKGQMMDGRDISTLPEQGYEQVPPIETQEEDEILRAAVADLPDEQRQIIEETYYRDQSHSVIAKARKIPLGTVKSRLRLALEHLRRRIRRDVS
jgi:RNA polymerase sigma-70 factor (ECF subfamily)